MQTLHDKPCKIEIKLTLSNILVISIIFLRFGVETVESILSFSSNEFISSLRKIFLESKNSLLHASVTSISMQSPSIVTVSDDVVYEGEGKLLGT